MISAVEFLKEALYVHFTYEQKMQYEGLFQQAKEMENAELEMYGLYKRSSSGMSEMPTDQFSIITYEGSEKYVGDKVFCVEFKPSIVNRISTITVNVDINNLYKRHIFFSTHDKALDYILSNQPCLSVNEILNAIGGSSEREKVDFDKLAEILKESTFCKLPIGI